MARALWAGSLRFWLVNVPVQKFSSVLDNEQHFKQLN